MLPPALIAALPQIPAPVILLEGTRRLPDTLRPQLARLARSLAEALPQALFRSGNAEGSDEAFAQGLAEIAPQRLQLVLPTPGMGRSRRPANAACHALDALPPEERETLAQACLAASPENRRLFELYRRGQSGTPAYGKSLYLVRDALKVLGSPALGLAPASLALLYLDENHPAGGGTGHTLRLCQQHGVPVLTQRHWLVGR
jgi:hypothetical protein